MGLVVQARPAHVHDRGESQQPFLLGVAVEPGQRAQRRATVAPGSTPLFEASGVALDICRGAPRTASAGGRTPGDELSQVEGVGVTGGPSVRNSGIL